MFRVIEFASPFAQSEGRVVSYVVSDEPANYALLHPWPPVAEFKVSQRFHMDVQGRRAQEYCDYLNKHTKIMPPIGEE